MTAPEDEKDPRLELRPLRGDETLEELRTRRAGLVVALERTRAANVGAVANRARRESEMEGLPGRRRIARSIEADFQEARARRARFIRRVEAALVAINEGIRRLAEESQRGVQMTPMQFGVKSIPGQNQTFIFLARFGRRDGVALEKKVEAELGFDEAGRLIGIRLPGVYDLRAAPGVEA